MHPYSLIRENCVHLWSIYSPDFRNEIGHLYNLLQNDEVQRAISYKFDIHRERFIIFRAMLRKVLSLYLEEDPKKIKFIYGPHGKPQVQNYLLQFNISHADDMALFAIMKNQVVGVDIERINNHMKEDLVKHLFTQEEYNFFKKSLSHEKTKLFYQIWSQKEAVIKLEGTGLHKSLNTFSVIEPISSEYFIQSVFVDSKYAAALATYETIKEKNYFTWTEAGHKALKKFAQR